MIDKAQKLEDVKAFLAKTRLDAVVTNKTIGVPAASITPLVLLQASKKLIDINKGTAQPDDRDDLRYSTFLGMEDFAKEHVEKDAGKYQRKALMKIKQKGNLSWMHSGFFTPQIQSVVIGNALSQNVDGINPMEHVDISTKITKLGPGGIPSQEAIPQESRNVNHSSFGFMDPFKISEDTKIGVSLRFAENVKKGTDGKIYCKVLDKHNKEVWIDHETLLDSVVEIPEA